MSDQRDLALTLPKRTKNIEENIKLRLIGYLNIRTQLSKVKQEQNIIVLEK